MQKLLVCLCVGQNQGVGAGGWGLGGWRFFMKSLQKSIVHIYSCLICLGGIHTYVMMSRMPIFVKILLKFQVDLDPWALDPHPSPPIFSSKQLNPQPWRPQDIQIRPISLHIINFKPRNASMTPQ